MSVDVREALETESMLLLKQCEEQLFMLEQKLKSTMDAGVAPDEFAKVQALSLAVTSAKNVFESIRDKR